MAGKLGQSKGIRSKICSKCEKEKEVESKRYCRSCHNSYMAKWRRKNPLTPEQIFKNNVRRKTRMRVTRGLLIQQPCEICGTNEKIEAHHNDYNKPYEITWLCSQHHREHHRNNNTND